jgi:hypothetical protein
MAVLVRNPELHPAGEVDGDESGDVVCHPGPPAFDQRRDLLVTVRPGQRPPFEGGRGIAERFGDREGAFSITILPVMAKGPSGKPTAPCRRF